LFQKFVYQATKVRNFCNDASKIFKKSKTAQTPLRTWAVFRKKSKFRKKLSKLTNKNQRFEFIRSKQLKIE